MKVQYQTDRETALILREMAGNCGSASESLIGAGMAGFVAKLEAQRARPVEDFMNGTADVSEPTGEAVMRAFQNGRSFRAKTVQRLAPKIRVSIIEP